MELTGAVGWGEELSQIAQETFDSCTYATTARLYSVLVCFVLREQQGKTIYERRTSDLSPTG